MPKPVLTPLFIVTALAVFAPTPGRAALYCKANCPNGSCWCIGCSCGCDGGGNASCGNSTATVAHTTQNSLALIQPFAGDDGAKEDIDLSSLRVAREASQGIVRAGSDGSFLYSPNPDFVGLDSFAFTACNYAGECETATVLVDVVPGQ